MTTGDAVPTATDPHLSGVFAPTIDEVNVSDLRVEGRLPPEIDGEYLRNGPHPRFSPIGDFIYPLDGDGMLHRVRISDGKGSYTDRFVRTPALIAEEEAGRALWGGATDRADLTSRLLVIAAEDPTADPITTVHLPHRVPLGLHGAWLPVEE